MLKRIVGYFALPLLLLLAMPPPGGWALTPPEGFAPGPDVIMGNLPSLSQAGSNGTQVGLAMGTDICNNGDVPANWFRLPETDHPVIPQNLYRMSGGTNNDDRFEQIGQSWAMHQFFPLQNNACGFGCTAAPDSAHLGVGCSTADSAGINGSQSIVGSRAWINPFTGIFPSTSNSHTGHAHDGTTHRILVEGNDLNTTMNFGATYYGEAQLVTPHEYAWCQGHPGECNMFNNVSYRQFNVVGTTTFSFSPVGATVRMTPALSAWPGATIQTIEPEPGVDGRVIVAYKVTNPSVGIWQYEYAIYNENLDRGIRSFYVPGGCGFGPPTNLGFHAPLNHPGIANDGTVGDAGYSNTPWTAEAGLFGAMWSTETFTQNPNANALRWGTLYNFRFQHSTPPTTVSATIGFFKTGAPILVPVAGPPFECLPTPSPTPTTPPTATPSATATASPAASATATPTPTPTPTPSATPSPVPTPILPPGGNGKIAFQSRRDGSFPDIYVMDPDGSNLTNLTNSLFSPEHDPDWSPDGTKIVFGINVDEFSQDNIYVMDANGANAVQLTSISKDFAPVWSPDGNKIAFGSYRDGNFEIYVMNADGSNPTNLTNNPAEDGSFGTSCTWSPDGGKIAFASNRGGGGNEIYVMAADGSNQVQLTNTPGDKTEPDWSPDGTKIAFANTLAGSQDIYVMNADGSNPIRLTNSPPGTNFEPNWSPDGTKIVFTSTRDPASPPGSNHETYVMDANGSNQTNLTNNPAPDFRPDWQRIAPSPTPTPTPSVTPSPTPAPAQALNLSTRLRVESGDRVLIGGFIITANPSATSTAAGSQPRAGRDGSGPSGAPKTVAIRAIGPSLDQFGIPDFLADPTLELRSRTGALLQQNDNWQDDPEQAAQLTALGLALQNPSESGMIASLSPESYTAIVAGKDGGTGVGLVEIYDTDPGANSQLANVSTRGHVQAGDNVMIGGFILGGGSNTQIAVRGIGPSLLLFPFPNALADPTLALHDANGALLISNDDWEDDPVQAAQLSAHGLALFHPKESGIFVSLAPGTFTAILAGNNGGTGIGVVELYNLGAP